MSATPAHNPNPNPPLIDGAGRGIWRIDIPMLVNWALLLFPEGRFNREREVIAGVRDLLLLVFLVVWWQEMSKKYRAIGLILLPYVLMRWKWCEAPYGTRVFRAAPADAAPATDDAPPPTPHRAQSLAPPPTVLPSFAFWCWLLCCEVLSKVNLALVLFLSRY
ncbi:hypothetical protein B9479_002148 [Cryptococcus floricola]|uniref:Uncharacterized protein n=1 Tax=Cryptococcus floricola TaxID=2591691 RepID=A0A5D3AZZ3_9TREE|nr:hypothetical protein B9479_002148 [Cryptococcus floricola]